MTTILQLLITFVCVYVAWRILISDVRAPAKPPADPVVPVAPRVTRKYQCSGCGAFQLFGNSQCDYCTRPRT